MSSDALNKGEPFRLIATRDEQRRIEYGSEGKDTAVSSQKGNFSDDGQKSTYSKVPSDFSQLDITGLFLIQQLRNRAIRVEQKPESVTISGAPARWLRVEGERKLHSAKNVAKDQFDVYVSAENGLLLGISRSFYEGRPERYTLTFTVLRLQEDSGSSAALSHRGLPQGEEDSDVCGSKLPVRRRSQSGTFHCAEVKVKHRFTWVLSLLSLLLFASLSSAQSPNDLGRVPYASYFSTGIESVNLYSGNVMLDIPVFSRPGREGLSAALRAVK